MVVVLGQGDDVALLGQLEAAAPGHLYPGTVELRERLAILVEDGDVELKLYVI